MLGVERYNFLLVCSFFKGSVSKSNDIEWFDDSRQQTGKNVDGRSHDLFQSSVLVFA